MKGQKASSILSIVFILSLVQLACSTVASLPISTSTPQPTATQTLVPTQTPKPTATPYPTRTPNLAATQKAEVINAEAQKYFDLGYLTTTEGKSFTYPDYSVDWAQSGKYKLDMLDQQASNFFMSAHFKWSSASRIADISGCGFVFAMQENGDHYIVFLDKSQILFLNADQLSKYLHRVGKMQGTGKVNFGKPTEKPYEADFTLIVKGVQAYVLVNGEMIGEYALSQNKTLKGYLGLTVLSDTNKDYGTRCEMTNVHAWIPNQ